MKVVASSENSNAFPSTGVYNGKITKHHHHHGGGSNPGGQRKDVENEEIRVYLSKLKELVPFMPKNRKLSKLEVIQYVIDYIYDLQYALETHPTLNSAAVHSAAAAMLSSQSQPSAIPSSGVNRQPLSVLPPNVNIQLAASSTAATLLSNITTTNNHNINNNSCCSDSSESNLTSVISQKVMTTSSKMSSPPAESHSRTNC